MFSTDVVNSDTFLDMPPSTQALYFHLGMHCDDDGFVYPKKVMRMAGSGEDDLKILLAKNFLISFESGVIVQRHWKVNNYIRSDRYRATTNREEIAQLREDKSGVYRQLSLMDTTGIPSGSISKEVSKKVEVSKDTGNANTDSEIPIERQNQRLAEVRENLRRRKIIN